MTLPPAIAFHPLCSPSLPKEKLGYRQYCYMMSHPQWNRALSWIRRARAWDNGIAGAWLLIELTERYAGQLGPRRCTRNQVQVYLFLLDTLRRGGRGDEYQKLWEDVRKRTDLTLSYRADSVAARSEYFVAWRGQYAEVNLLWLCRKKRATN